MANTIVKVGNMASTNVDAFLKSVQFTTAMQNGSHIVLNGLVSGKNQVYAATPCSDVTAQEILLLEAPVIVETGTNRLRVGEVDPRNFTVAANTPARARHLKVGDDVTLSVDGFSSTPTVGEYAIPANGATKLAPSSTIGSTKLSYKVIEQTYISVGSEFVTAYRLLVVKSS